MFNEFVKSRFLSKKFIFDSTKRIIDLVLKMSSEEDKYKLLKMFEKYDVNDTTLYGGGGEYDLQDGFGWTNGVARALMELK